ncbi:Uncharacterized conserved protein (UCP012943) [Quillaja saponaria]|uniref:Uncharacterized conserved protein (UCP012943) n=1 Tax=Quillaja saponaria TaxID=32244 RepID=A0AAD7PAP8_QUISA|nr:Uncharacterized conserved protein (UCP012943) [Quillaja saponaria]
MGGGAAMRTVAKVAGIGVATGGLRGVPVMPPAEQSVRNASRPVSAILSLEGAKSTEVLPSKAAAAWEDGWDFADENDLVMEAGEPMPRVVFSGVPSYQEAKVATTELKDALDKVYLSSPKSATCEGYSAGDQVSDLPLLSRSDMETKSCAIETTIATPPVPKQALQAFKFLSSSPEAQNVVTSIACDPNVWNAMMENPVLKDFVVSHQTSVEYQEEPPKKFEVVSDSCQTEDSKSSVFDVMGTLQNIRLTVTEMVCNVSKYLQNIFGPAAAEKMSSDADGNAKATFMDNTTLGASLMGLVVMVVMVVVLKRV